MPNRIRERRQAAGLTLQDVAEKLGTTAVTVSRWEREPQRVTLPILDKLADAIGCNREELLARSLPLTNSADLNESALSGLAMFYGIPAERIGLVVVATDMMAPTLVQGDHCFIDKSITWVDNAGVYAFRMNGEARIIRGHRNLEGGIRLTCDNPLYKVDFTWSDDKLEVIGKVIGHHRKI